jgi:hypothetical protein
MIPTLESIHLEVSAVAPGVADPDVETDADNKKQIDNTVPRILCPVCDWQPLKHDRWLCSCGHWWNTFDTGGVCPTCLQQWTMTQCLSFACLRWSPHSDWYEY